MQAIPQISPKQAAALVKDGNTIMAGGFGMTGNPVTLLHALAETNTRNLTYIGNNIGEPNLGGGRLLLNRQIKKVIGSFLTSNPDAVKAAQDGELKVELLPQGSLAEAIRAGGAGIGGFYSPSSVGTPLESPEKKREIDGREYSFVPALRADVAFIRAWQADAAGNLVYRMTEQNFNRAMASAANIVVAEVEELLPLGALAPNSIHTSGIYIDYLVYAPLQIQALGSSASVEGPSRKVDPARLLIAQRALAELQPGDVVNLGVGMPTLIAEFITLEHDIRLHTENGMLGVGPSPPQGGAMDYPVNASKTPVTALPGSSYFDSAESFAMIRGGHVDVAVMGALQVDEHANLANWSVPGRPLLGVGGAMDLASGAQRLIITMQHTDRNDASKIVPDCTLPLTARSAVSVVITELAVFAYPGGKLTLIELMPEATLDDVRNATVARFEERLENS